MWSSSAKDERLRAIDVSSGTPGDGIEMGGGRNRRVREPEQQEAGFELECFQHRGHGWPAGDLCCTLGQFFSLVVLEKRSLFIERALDWYQDNGVHAATRFFLSFRSALRQSFGFSWVFTCRRMPAQQSWKSFSAGVSADWRQCRRKCGPWDVVTGPLRWLHCPFAPPKWSVFRHC